MYLKDVNSRQRNHLYNDKLSYKELNQHYKHLSRNDDGTIQIWHAILCTNLRITSIPFQALQTQILNTFVNLEYKDLRVHKIWIKKHKWGFKIEAWCEPNIQKIFGTNRRFEWSEPDCYECRQHIWFSDGNNIYFNHTEPEVNHHPDCKLGWVEGIMTS